VSAACWTQLDDNQECPSCAGSLCWDGKPRNDDCSCNFCAGDENQVCWDGSARKADCSCPDCSAGKCWDGSTPDALTCSCPECPREKCWDGLYPLVSKGCQCDACPKEACPFNLPRQANCECYWCEKEVCWDGSEPEKVYCECPACNECWDGSIPDPETCACTPCDKTEVCWDGTLPLQSNMCECPTCEDVPCKDGSQREEDCSCPGDDLLIEPCSENPCPGGYDRNPLDCSCPISYFCVSAASCRENYTFNQRTCECEPNGLQQVFGEDHNLFNEMTCALRCPAGQWLNRKYCRCERRPVCQINSCAEGYILDSKLCKCVRMAKQKELCKIGACAPGYQLNEEDCECVNVSTKLTRRGRRNF